MSRTYADMPGGSFQALGFGHLPFRQAVRHGDVVYLSGQVAVEARPTAMAAQARLALGRDGRALHPGDVASQTRVAMENVRAVLAQFGATTEDMVKRNSYYVGLRDSRTTVPIRAEYFTAGICATGVGVDALVVPGLLIEMDVVAMV